MTPGYILKVENQPLDVSGFNFCKAYAFETPLVTGRKSVRPLGEGGTLCVGLAAHHVKKEKLQKH